MGSPFRVGTRQRFLYDQGYKGKDQIHPIPGPIEDRFTEKELHHIRMLYAEKVTLVDKWVGKLLDKIRDLGFWDNTLIILTSDHGQPLGNHKHGHGLLRKARRNRPRVLRYYYEVTIELCRYLEG